MTDAADSALLEWLRAALQTGHGELLGSGYQATAHLYRGPHGDIVVKSAHVGGVLGFFGKRALAREHRVYSRLGGVRGVPRCYGFLDDVHLVLEHIAAAFAPGVKYPEREVDATLRAFHPDHAALRRYLVDEELLTRDAGVYWRIGGPV